MEVKAQHQSRVSFNADTAKLLLNNKSPGSRQKKDNELHAKWNVLFEGGALKAVSRKNGKIIAIDEVGTATAPAKIILKADRYKTTADGADFSFVV